MARENKIVVKGEMCFSFGKNGSGLSDELLVIGNLINQLSKDNFIFLEEAFIGSEDVYDLKFCIRPHYENEFYLETEEERAERRKKQEEAIK